LGGVFATLSCLFKLSHNEALSGADDCEFAYQVQDQNTFFLGSAQQQVLKKTPGLDPWTF
jgi:hypothetical protein